VILEVQNGRVTSFVRLIGISVGVAVVVSGCATSPTSPPLPTSHEVLIFALQNLNGDWDTDSSLTDRHASYDGDIRIAEANTLDIAFAKCVGDAGYAEYSIDRFGTLSISGPPAAESQIERGVRHYCDFPHQFSEPSTALLSSKEREYLYEYYRKWLVPCLAVAGYQVSDLPTRSAFISDWLTPGWWSPYDALQPVPIMKNMAFLHAKCPALPPAMASRVSH
jgi:hypothetical protein